VRVLAHEICRPVKLTRVTKDDGKIVWEKRAVKLSTDVALLYLNGLEGRWGRKALPRNFHRANLGERRQHSHSRGVRPAHRFMVPQHPEAGRKSKSYRGRGAPCAVGAARVLPDISVCRQQARPNRLVAAMIKAKP